MMRSCIAVLVASMALTSVHSMNLNDPIIGDEPRWEKWSSNTSVCFMQETGNPSLCFVMDRGEYQKPIFLSLHHPQETREILTFFEECEKYLDLADKERGPKKVGLILAGESFQIEVRDWLQKNLAQRFSNLDLRDEESFDQSSIRVVQEDGHSDPHLILAYDFRLPVPNTFRDLRKLWVMTFIQQMTLARLAREGITPPYTLDTKEFLLPSTTLQIQIPVEESQWQTCLQIGLQKIKEIAETGFTADELQVVKNECQALIQELQRDKNMLFAPIFQAHSFLHGLHALSYIAFLNSASVLINSVTPVDIAIVMHECFLGDQRTVGYATAQTADPNWIEEAAQIIDFVEKAETQKIAYLRTELEAPNLFEQLPINDYERELIYKIVDTMARDNVIKLGWKRKSMEKKGKKIRHVHPLRFLGYVFSDRHLRQCMREISRSSFKWYGFIDGMRNRIEEEAARGGLLPYAPGFASQLQVDEERVRRYLEKRDWEGLVRYLL